MKTVEERFEILKQKCLPAPVVVTDPPIDGFLKAWELPGYAHAKEYIGACTASQLAAMFDWAAPSQLAAMFAWAETDAQKSALCDAAGIET